MVKKQFNVADKQLFVTFEEWTDNLISFKIGYYEKNNPTEQFWEATPEDRIDDYPNGLPYALIGTDVDFSQGVKVYRTGKIAAVGICCWRWSLLIFILNFLLLRVILPWRSEVN